MGTEIAGGGGGVGWVGVGVGGGEGMCVWGGGGCVPTATPSPPELFLQNEGQQ